MAQNNTVWKPPVISINEFALPSLLPLHDKKLVRQYSHHGSCLASHTPQSDDETSGVETLSQPSGQDSFRKLEWLGDSLLYVHATQVLMKRYPGRSVSELERMRQLLTSNNTLSHLCRYLRLYRHLRVGASYMISTRIITQNLAADLFEAYVGALHKDSEARGRPEIVGEWLEKVWSQDVLPGLEHWGRAKHVGQKTGDKQHRASQVHKVPAGQTKGKDEKNKGKGKNAAKRQAAVKQAERARLMEIHRTRQQQSQANAKRQA
ncbi:ribonuclease III domain-containing protein [Filobasidium floriforme]|uniref:ribonuclease III domain-containing protein n=1 Tax=Filobasidium floriforme TaxID=5210 RepID=UPI001E8CC55D|nr:ribonuclease III domain-containing protein [Filobasidium floriforme]KAH8090349.1 ribonuclease III domain-containing protein [Filobasidium floriforme]